MNTISVSKNSYRDMLRLEVQLLAVMENHKKQLTDGENALVHELRSLLEINVKMLSSLGLPDERKFFEPIEKLMRELL